jgi:hypothetical protein
MLFQTTKLTPSLSSLKGSSSFFPFSIILLLSLTLCIFSCDTPVLNQLEALNTANEKINNLKKSKEEVKAIEDKAALVRESDYLLEYEYPIREDELYVIAYRFNTVGCYEIKLDTYFNGGSDAKRLSNRIVKNISSNPDYGKAAVLSDIYTWKSTTKKINIELNSQSQERGMINLIIQLTQ